MNNYKVVEKDNEFAVHFITWNFERGQAWIEKYGDSKMFTDKTLTKSSSKTVKN